MDKEEMRIIPKKNYLIITVIFAITIAIVLFCRYQYIRYQDYLKTKPVISGTLKEMGEKDLYTYIAENDDAIIYIGTASDDNCRELEIKLKDYVIKNNLKDNITYLNITDVKNIEDFYKDFNVQFASEKKLEYYPAFIIFKDGKILDLVSRHKNQYLTIGNIEQMLEEYEIEG